MLSLSSEDYFLEDADSHIQANLEDSVVKEALKSGVDLREYSAQVLILDAFYDPSINRLVIS